MLNNENNMMLTAIDTKSEMHAENPIAIRILELREQIESIEVELKEKENQFLEAMRSSGIKSINTKYGNFIRTERRNLKVDADKAKIYLDSIGATPEFSKLDDTKIKKVYDII
jgi:hypothetical protein